MKRIIWVILAVFLSYGASEAHFSHSGQRGRQFGLFYNSLQAHGEWVNVRFGTAWRPFRVDNQWRPYLHGRWMWTDYGWYWSSYEPFGWATYHYGRWTYDDYYGWIWIPGDEWGPAWVEWRYDDDYIGWSPLPPSAQWSFSVGLTFGHSWIAPVHYWNFVPCGNFSSVNVVNYIQAPDISRRIYGRTRHAGSVRSVNNRIVNDAVRLDRVQRRSREPIRKVDLTDRSSPGEDRLVRGKDRETLEIYRPGGQTGRTGRVGQAGQAGQDRNATGVTGTRRNPGAVDPRRSPAPDDATGRRSPGDRVARPDRKVDADTRGITNPGKSPSGRRVEPGNSQSSRVAPKRGAQRSLEESKSMRSQQNGRGEIRSRNDGKKQESRTVRPEGTKTQNKPSVRTQRPAVKRVAPAPRQSGSKKRKPDG